MRRRGTKSTSASERARLLRIFGPPQLIDGEDPVAYDALLAQVSAIVKPLDILEEFWVRDTVDLQWEVLRYRRHKTNLMATKKFEAFNRFHPLYHDVRQYFPDYGDEEFEQLVTNWLNQDISKKANEAFASAGLTMDVVMAMTLLENLDAIARIDGMIAMAEARRNAALRELERHRATLARRLRHAVEQVEDARFEMIETKPVEKKSAA
jgi:hypothetical protein